MTWLLRLRADIDAYQPNECPDYSGAPGLFSIKLYHGGDISERLDNYVGGAYDYVDCCDTDTMSILELISMIKECGEKGAHNIYYKLPNTEMANGLWPIDTDVDVLELCELLHASKLVYVYVVTTNPVTTCTPYGNVIEEATQEYAPSQNMEYVDNESRTEFDNEQVRQLIELEGLNNEFVENLDDEDHISNENNGDHRAGDENVINEPDDAEVLSDNSGQSFHGDSSNNDNSDDDFTGFEQGSGAFMKKKDGNGKGDGHASQNISKDKDMESDSSEYGGSDDEMFVCNSTDDEGPCYAVFDEDHDMADPVFKVGMMFATSKIFREAVKKQAIMQRRPVIQCRNYGIRVKFICEDGCPWTIYASKMQNSDTYQIKKYKSIHTCKCTFDQKQINAPWIARHYEDEIRINPSWPLHAFQKKVINDWNCHVSIYAIGRAKRKALENINGKHVEQFALLWDYGNKLMKAMPDSTVKIMTENEVICDGRKRFRRFYNCLGPIKRGFRNECRPLIGLDGCHLKSPFGGQLLAAIGVDANDGMYPVAWAVVEAENNDSWMWFLELIVNDLGIQNDGGWCFISDRQKGLINALEDVVPGAEHRFCVMHLYRNMWKEHKGLGVRKTMWKAARSTTEYTFKKNMEEMKEIKIRKKKAKKNNTDDEFEELPTEEGMSHGVDDMQTESTSVIIRQQAKARSSQGMNQSGGNDAGQGSTSDARGKNSVAGSKTKGKGIFNPPRQMKTQKHAVNHFQGSQGGIFNPSPSFHETPYGPFTVLSLGVQPEKYNTKNKTTVTSLRNLEAARDARVAARNDRIEKNKKKVPQWKL